MTTVSRGEQFVQLYNQLDSHLHRLTGSPPEETFASVVKKAANSGHSAVKAMRHTLVEYGDLRNAIVHDPKYRASEIIADPRPEVIRDLQRLVDLVTSPPRLMSGLHGEPQVFSEDDPLISVLHYMRDHDFSQVVVRSKSTLGLLTANGIAGWLTDFAEASGFLVTEGLVSHALRYEQPGVFTLMKRDATLFDAYEFFSRTPKEGEGRPAAVLVTHSGKASEAPLRIATPWDVFPIVDLTK